jgi:hypothetical protein
VIHTDPNMTDRNSVSARRPRSNHIAADFNVSTAIHLQYRLVGAQQPHLNHLPHKLHTKPELVPKHDILTVIDTPPTARIHPHTINERAVERTAAKRTIITQQDMPEPIHRDSRVPGLNSPGGNQTRQH